MLIVRETELIQPAMQGTYLAHARRKGHEVRRRLDNPLDRGLQRFTAILNRLRGPAFPSSCCLLDDVRASVCRNELKRRRPSVEGTAILVVRRDFFVYQTCNDNRIVGQFA